jgi:hypothetical protein
VALVVGAAWYSPLLFGRAYMEVRGIDPGAMADMRPPVGELLGEFAKNLVIAFVLAHFVVRLGVGDWKGAVQLGLWVWVGFQAMLLMGVVLHEKMPWMLYAIHAGDAREDTPHDRHTRRVAHVRNRESLEVAPPGARRRSWRQAHRRAMRDNVSPDA